MYSTGKGSTHAIMGGGLPIYPLPGKIPWY
jgi:hypothetical protein